MIFFTGSNIPSSLWTLQATIGCGVNTGNFFNLPNSGGVGEVNTVGTPYRSENDCATATPASLDCNAIELTIHGPGIPNQRIECSFVLPIDLLRFSAIENDNVVDLY